MKFKRCPLRFKAIGVTLKPTLFLCGTIPPHNIPVYSDFGDCVTDILKAIPHRPPFLFIDKVVEKSETKIIAEKELTADLDFFKGHYPSFPIMPGALTCEAIFQAGAILLSGIIEGNTDGVPAVTRIRDAKFKKMIRPNDIMQISAQLDERVGPAFYMKGSVSVKGELVATVKFTCAMVPLPEEK